MDIRLFAPVLCLGLLLPTPAKSAEPLPPELSVTVSNQQKQVNWQLYPGAQGYNLLSAGQVGGPFTNDGSGVITGNTWRGTNGLPAQFFRLGVTPISSNALLNANLLNRLAYGPTPDDLARLATIDPQQYIGEQLAPEGIQENLDNYIVARTNGVSLPPNTNWSFVTVTGTFTSPTLYLYLTAVGDVYVDDIQLQAVMSYQTNVVVVGTNSVTNVVALYGTNLVRNGDFEAPLAGSWTLANNTLTSGLSTAPDPVCAGTGSLHLVSTAPGSTGSSGITQVTTPAGITNGAQVRLSYFYLPSANSSKLTVRLSGSGVISSAADAPPTPRWIYVTATGVATATPTAYLYLGGAGTAYVDDLKLVSGSVAGAGANLIANGDFESGALTPWQTTANFTNSSISSNLTYAGAGALRLVATAGGSGSGNSLFLNPVSGLNNGQLYTVSFWYLPASSGAALTFRLSGSATSGLLSATPDTTGPATLHLLLDERRASLSNLRAWFCNNAVASQRQLHEILSQFWENHFVTEHSKSQDYIANNANNIPTAGNSAADLEYREMTKWRNAMLNPACTFYDLLKISAESPAMIIYLDTVNSKGDTALRGSPPTLRTNIANENYARELLELFCNGVDNGYDQHDIEQMSRAWTGWSVELVDAPQLNNPFAPPSVTYNPGVSSTAKSNIVGVWAFNYKQANHNTNNKYIFYNWNQAGTLITSAKTVPSRFGAPWAGRNYALTITNSTGTNSIRDGYIVVQHLANLPFTSEYLSVKLCRLFIHDDFPNPTTVPGTPEYNFYDYTNPNLSEEAKLVHECMLAWENSSPKGQLRPVLNTIFNSHLFRTHAASMQKIKTPLEFCASAVRALRSRNANGTYTATTDGGSSSFRDPMSRMGAMGLFNRAEPNGYPEAGAPWISAGTLAERARFIQALLLTGTGDDAGNNSANPVQLLKSKLSSGSWNNAGAVADYFLGILYPGEGPANLSQYRASAINFLNTADNGAASAFSALSNTGATYDTRVRGMVSMLMILPRFQEQ